MNIEDLKIIEQAEDLTIIRHYEAILRIIDDKCNRCKAISCDECIFSADKIKGNTIDNLMLVKNNR